MILSIPTLNRVESATMDWSKDMCRRRLGSAFRTGLACTIVGLTTLYGPAHLRHHLAFPAFSYLTTILIVSDATLGDTLRGCWYALSATVQVIPTTILCLWLIGPGRFSAGPAGLAVAVSAFVVALPESTHLTSKRIAFGQIVVVYVGVVVYGKTTGAVMLPLHVASNTALGAVASVLALILPYPRMAYWEVIKACQLYAETASERLNLLLKVFSAMDNSAALDLISQAKSFSKTGAKLLQNIKLNQESMIWERPQIRFLQPNRINPEERLQEMELPIRGMEFAVTSFPSFPNSLTDHELNDVLLNAKTQICKKLEQTSCYIPSNSMTAPETEGGDLSYNYSKAFFPTKKDLPAFFFLFCINLLQDESYITLNPNCPIKEESRYSKQKLASNFKRIWGSHNTRPLSNERLVFAFKCSISLGLAVLFGLIYNKENGYWSGLTIAISFVSGRQATFTMANARAQGTVMGSVYGVLGCFILQKSELRFLLLLPWIIFTSFLRHSRMYGQAGGISAVIGALLILGRKSYGTPSEFAIARIAEAFIGLSCLIAIEFMLQPTRAATLAKMQLPQSFGTFSECIEELVLCRGQKNIPAASILLEKQNKLKHHVSELEKFAGEAELEPNLWFLPFHDACYRNIFGSLTKMVDLLNFVACKTEFLLQVSHRPGFEWKELQEQLDRDLALFKEKVGSSLKCLEEITLFNSLSLLEEEVQKEKTSDDIEMGKSSHSDVFRFLSTDEEDVDKILNSFILHSKELCNEIHANDDEKLKSQMVLCLSSLGFCISSLMNETIKIEKEVRELVKWENPSNPHKFV